MAELRDEILFKQPESTHFEDCPICCLPVPIDQKKSGFYSCCSKQICRGCSYAKTERELEGSLEQKCPFCRAVMPKTDEEYNYYFEHIDKKIIIIDQRPKSAALRNP